VAGETTPPERPALHPFLTTAPAVEALRQLERGLGHRKPLVLLTGEPGTGKSMVAHEALRRWEMRVASATLPAGDVEPVSLAAVIATRFGGRVKTDAVAIVVQERLVEALANATAGGRVAVLLVDDAHALPDEVLLEISRLVGVAAKRQCPLEVLLSGEPSLVARFAEPGLAAADAEVSVRATVGALSANDTRHYLLQRPHSEAGPGVAMFSRKACRDIHAATHGIVREVESLAAEAVRVAQATNSPTVSTDHVRAAERKLYGVKGASRASGHKPSAKHAAGPAKAQAKAAPAAKVEAKVAEAAATPPAPADAPEPVTAADATPAESKPASDSRVKDWVSRFGGSGVNIGGIYLGRGKRELEDLPDLSSVKTWGEGAAAPASLEEHAPAPTSKRSARAEPAPEPAATPMLAAGKKPAAKSSGRGDVNERGELLAPSPAWVPAKPALRRGEPDGVLRSAFVWQMCTLVMAVALVAVILGQRRSRGPEESTTVEAQVEPAEPSESAPREPRASAPAGTRTAARTETSTAPEQVTPAPEDVDDLPLGEPALKPTTPANATTPRNLLTPVGDPAHAKLTPEESAQAPVVVQAPARPGERYTIAVGSFPEAGMARAERRQVEKVTRHRVYVGSFKLGGVRMYRLEVGSFGSRNDAEAEARGMISRGLTRGTDVVALDE